MISHAMQPNLKSTLDHTVLTQGRSRHLHSPPAGLHFSSRQILEVGFQEKEFYDNNSRSTFILCSYFNKRKFMQRVESLIKILVQRFQRFQKD